MQRPTEIELLEELLDLGARKRAFLDESVAGLADDHLDGHDAIDDARSARRRRTWP